MRQQTRCVVTGLGMICGLGNNVENCWNAAIHGRSGITEVTSLDTSKCYTHKGAEVHIDDAELPANEDDRAVRLCINAAKEAIQDASLSLQEDESIRAGVILGSCVGGAASIDRYFNAQSKNESADTADILNMSASSISNEVALYLGLNGITATIVNACAAGTMSIAYACDLIRAGKADVFLTGGTDSFSSLAFSGFHALHALDDDVCAPFNRSKGITLGEGSGILIVESYEHAVKRSAKIYCEILGSGVSSDAYHITAPRPDGQGQMHAIQKAVFSSGIDFADLDYINAHGTGTAKNDEAECLSLHTLFSHNSHLSVSSTKSMTGHCLGAAGSIEAVFAVKSICESAVPPTIGYSSEEAKAVQEQNGNIDFVPNCKKNKTVQYAMSNSFAFGGNNASIIFSRNAHPIPNKINSSPIYITGYGALLGKNTSDGKGFCTSVNTSDFKKYGINMAFYRKLDWFSQLQLLSGAAALQDSGITIDASNETETGMIIGTADGPMTEITAFQKNIIQQGLEKGSAFVFPNTVYNAAGGYLSIYSGIKGYNATIANSCQAGLQSICYAADILHKGDAKIMLASGTDENTDMDRQLYQKLGVLKEVKPYNLQEDGFLLGEGSVTIILETAESADGRKAKKYAELVGYASAHQSIPSGTINGSEKAMERAILLACSDAGITPNDIDGICGFGNGHSEIDNIELSVYRKMFQSSISLFPIKEYTGEARAAASTMQAAYAAMLLSNTISEPVKAYQLGQNKLSEITILPENYQYILSVSFGMGGSYSAVILKKATN